MKKQIHSLKWQMLGVALACWLVPVALVLSVMGWYTADSLSQRTAENLADQFLINLRMCAERLDTAVKASRLASYDPTIKSTWSAYRQDGRYNTLYQSIKAFLDRQYRPDNRFRFALFWLYEDPYRIGLSTLTESTGSHYEQLRHYWDFDHTAVMELASGLDTSVGFLQRGKEVYLVRNVVDSDFAPIGVLVLSLNLPYFFENLTALDWTASVTVSLAGEPVVLKGAFIDPDAVIENLSPASDRRLLREEVKQDDYTLSAAADLDFSVLLSQYSGYRYVLFGLAVLVLPLLLLVVHFFQRKISQPIQAMMEGAQVIEEGRLGHQLTYRANSREFKYLTDSFNHMSGQLQNQFDRLYQEELALRDARIKALQSHINPHFLNNTLEIINWEARMNDDARVSKMIEALSSLLDAAIDRDKKPEVSLQEELGCVNAYLYIIDQRFGKRLAVTQETGEGVLELMVPRLILQPVIENAVEHGIGPGGHGTISLRCHRDENCLYLDVTNDGSLSDEDEAHIARLLSHEYDSARESSGNIGISNVNQRLRILYGPPSGLSICRVGETRVLARLTIALRDTAGAV